MATDQREQMTEITRQIAAELIVKHDPRPWVITPYAQIRRENSPATFTESAARHVMDASAAFEGMASDEQGKDLNSLMREFSPSEYREIKQRAVSAANQGTSSVDTSGGTATPAGEQP